jgi:hypothetical protein
MLTAAYATRRVPDRPMQRYPAQPALKSRTSRIECYPAHISPHRALWHNAVRNTALSHFLREIIRAAPCRVSVKQQIVVGILLEQREIDSMHGRTSVRRSLRGMTGRLRGSGHDEQ